MKMKLSKEDNEWMNAPMGEYQDEENLSLQKRIAELGALLRIIRNNYLNEPSISVSRMQIIKRFIDAALQDKKGVSK